MAEAGRRFVAWLGGNVPALRVATPAVWAGPVLAGEAAPVLAGEAAPFVAGSAGSTR